MAEKQRRQNFRITYPASDRPTALIFRGQYKVIDLSAGGLRIFAGPDYEKFTLTKNEFAIKVVFKSGKSVELIGKVLRFAKGEVVFKLNLEIPLNIVNEEQINLRKLYKK